MGYCEHGLFSEDDVQGRPQDLAGGGGGSRFFFSDLEFARGFGGMPPPPRKFFKMVQLVRVGVYFDQILSLKISIITIFYITILKIAIFYIKE